MLSRRRVIHSPRPLMDSPHRVILNRHKAILNRHKSILSRHRVILSRYKHIHSNHRELFSPHRDLDMVNPPLPIVSRPRRTHRLEAMVILLHQPQPRRCCSRLEAHPHRVSWVEPFRRRERGIHTPRLAQVPHPPLCCSKIPIFNMDSLPSLPWP
jgi:hypothetical protein